MKSSPRKSSRWPLKTPNRKYYNTLRHVCIYLRIHILTRYVTSLAASSPGDRAAWWCRCCCRSLRARSRVKRNNMYTYDYNIYNVYVHDVYKYLLSCVIGTLERRRKNYTRATIRPRTEVARMYSICIRRIVATKVIHLLAVVPHTCIFIYNIIIRTYYGCAITAARGKNKPCFVFFSFWWFSRSGDRNDLAHVSSSIIVNDFFFLSKHRNIIMKPLLKRCLDCFHSIAVFDIRTKGYLRRNN